MDNTGWQKERGNFESSNDSPEELVDSPILSIPNLEIITPAGVNRLFHGGNT